MAHDAISQGPKNSRIPGPNHLPLPLVMDMHASRTLCCINHRCINSYYESHLSHLTCLSRIDVDDTDEYDKYHQPARGRKISHHILNATFSIEFFCLVFLQCLAWRFSVKIGKETVS
jgi:hypothetical protein